MRVPCGGKAGAEGWESAGGRMFKGQQRLKFDQKEQSKNQR